jgi:Spy/CpxP family protein refolding chaperone
MKRASISACVVIGLSVAMLCLADDEAPTSQPAAATSQPSTVKVRKIRLPRPWSQMTDLTDEQKQEVYRIHRRTLDEIRKLRQQETQDIVATLTDPQKEQWREIVKQNAERKRQQAKRYYERARQRLEQAEQEAAETEAQIGD